MPSAAIDMPLGLVEADVVELAAILPLRQHVLPIKRDPLAPQLLLRRRQHEAARRQRIGGVLAVLGPGELGRGDAADAVGRGEIVAAVAQFDMIARKRRGRAHHRLEGLALEPHLPRRFGVGGRRVVHPRNVEERERIAARADFDIGIGVDADRGVVDRLPEILQLLDRFLGPRVIVRRVVAGRDAVQILPVDLEALIAPLADDPPRDLP